MRRFAPLFLSAAVCLACLATSGFAGQQAASAFQTHPAFGNLLELGNHAAPVPAERHILFCEGVDLKLREKHAEAIEVFKEALALDPGSPSILFEIGFCTYRLGKNKESVDYLERALKGAPGNGPAHETLAFVYAALGQRGKALTELEAAARSAVRPRNHQGLVRRLAWIYERQNDRKNAITWYRYLLECGHRDRGAYASLGALELKEGLHDAALRSFREVVRRTPSDKPAPPEVARAYAGLSEHDRNRAIQSHEGAVGKAADPAILEVLALAYQAAGREDDMLQAITRAAALASPRALTQKLYLAEYLEEAGQIRQALEWRRKILETKKTPEAADFIRLAGLYVKHEAMEPAAAIYREAMAIDPKRRDLLERIGDCYIEIHEWGKAAAALEELLEGKELGAAHAKTLFQLGEITTHAGKPKLAAERKKKAYDLLANAIGTRDGTTTDVQIHLMLADFHYADHEPEKALGYLLVAQQLDPEDPRKLLLVALGHKRARNWAEAAATYEKFLAKDSRSLAAAGTLYELATCQESLGKDAQAAATRTRARTLLLAIARTTENPEAKAAVHAQLGEVAMERNEPKVAIEHFLEALSLDPKRSIFHLYLGECYQLLADWQRAAAHIESFLGPTEPGDAHARTIYRLGVAQARAGQRERGAASKRKAVDLLRTTLQTLEQEGRGTHAHKAEILRDLASLLSGEKKHAEAVATVRRAIELAPPGRRTQYRLLLASFYDEMKRYDESEKVLVDAHAAEPENASVLNHLGYFYAERGRNLDQAVELVKKALDYEPINGAYLDSLGWAYYQQGKHKEALELLLRAVRYEEDGVIRDHVGDVYHKLGETEKAREAWSRALSLDPDIEGVSEKILKTTPRPNGAPKKPEPGPDK